MKARNIILATTVLFLACAGMTSCSKQPNATSALLSSPRAAAADPATDYTKPYLTDEKMQQFITSMKEEHNPLELIFKRGGQMQNPASLAGRVEEFNSFARKYGFQDYQDYTAVWGRIMAGEMQLWGAETFEKMISGAQAELKKPDLAPEMRKMNEDQLAAAQKGLDDMTKRNTSVNAADMELVKKYKSQIEEAEKKYQAGH